MFSNRVAFTGLAIACIVAAGVGGYFATRQNAVPVPVGAAAAATESVAPKATETAPVTSGALANSAPIDAPSASPVPVATSTPAPASQSRRTESSRKTAANVPSSNSTTRRAAVADRPATAAAPAPLPASTSVSPIADASPNLRPDEHLSQDLPTAPSAPQKTIEELVVSANSVIGLQTETRISSETSRVEDRVDAKVTRDVRVADKVAVPAGSRAIGSVMLVERGGKFKERARIGIRFTALVLADGTRIPISTETIYREGEPPTNGSAAKVGGGAIAGTILGAILGGSKGAAVGAAAGAGGGAAAVEAGERNAVTLPAGTPMTVRLLSPVTVTIEQP